MDDKTRKLLNCEEVFIKSIPIFMEAFIKYYGEDCRKEIEEKFSKAKFIAYLTNDDIDTILREYGDNKTEELMEKFIANHNLKFTKKELLSYCNSFDYSDDTMIKKIIDLIYASKIIDNLTQEKLNEISTTRIIPEEYKDMPQWLKNQILYSGDLERVKYSFQINYDEIEPYLEKINPDISSFKGLIERPEFIELYNLKDAYNQMIVEYNEAKKQFEEFYLEKERISNVRYKIVKECYRDYIKENLDLIPEDKRTGLDEFLEDSEKVYQLDNYIKNTLGGYLYATLDIESFSSEQEDILNNPDTPEWQINSIKASRIKFFKNQGFDLGDDYETYLHNEEIQKILPDMKRLDQLLVCREKHFTFVDEEVVRQTKRYQKLISEIDSLNLLDKDIPINPSLYKIKGTFVSPNVVKTPAGYELFSLVAINCGSLWEDCIDHNIVHELNHLFELHLNNVMENTYEALCGWDTLVENINQASVDNSTSVESKRSYELFNEIINEIIAQEICEIMQNDNIHVFGDEKNSKIKNVTSYEHSMFLIKDFYNEYKDKIIESRRNGRIDIIYNEVGKENFDELNSLFEVFNEHFSGMKIYSLLRSMKDNEDNEMTRIYYDLIDKRDHILEKMRQYKEMNSHREQQL